MADQQPERTLKEQRADLRGQRDLIAASLAAVQRDWQALEASAAEERLDEGERGFHRHWMLPVEHLNHSTRLLLEDLAEHAGDTQTKRPTKAEAKAAKIDCRNCKGGARKTSQYREARLTVERLEKAAEKALDDLKQKIDTLA